MEQASVRNIKSDLEYVQNQVAYLEKFQIKIQTALKPLSSFSRKWNGLKEEELVYKEIDRWLKCYQQLHAQLKIKVLSDIEVQKLITSLPEVAFVKPTSLKEDNLTGLKKVLYMVIPPYRIAYNKKKIRLVKKQVLDFAAYMKLVKSLSFKIEAYYMDGV